MGDGELETWLMGRILRERKLWKLGEASGSACGSPVVEMPKAAELAYRDLLEKLTGEYPTEQELKERLSKASS